MPSRLSYKGRNKLNVTKLVNKSVPNSSCEMQWERERERERESELYLEKISSLILCENAVYFLIKNFAMSGKWSDGKTSLGGKFLRISSSERKSTTEVTWRHWPSVL